jgi:DNA-binding protein HU-beta
MSYKTNYNNTIDAKRGAMTKDELITRLAESTSITKKKADEILSALADTVSESLQKGEKTVLPGIGSLSCVGRKARTGRDPRTGAEIKIPAKKAAKFSVSTALATALNNTGKAKID